VTVKEDLEHVTYEEVVKKDKWRKAIEEEMTTFIQN
jgi:hypothetical protein